MLAYPIRKALPALALTAVALPTVAAPKGVAAQVRDVVSKQVSVGRASAELDLEFVDGGSLHVAFEDGEVLLDGEALGNYVQGGELDVAWRSLLGQAVALDDGPLAQALSDWIPPDGLEPAPSTIAARLDRALEAAVLDVQVDRRTAEAPGDAGAFLRALLGSTDRLRLLEEALTGLGADVRVHVGEDVDVSADEVVSGNLVVIEGDARIAGTLDGDVVVVGGTLELLEGGSVSGAVRLVDSELLGDRDAIGDGVIDVLVEDRELQSELQADVRAELRDEIRRELRQEMRDRDEGLSLLAPFRPVIRGVGGVLENLVAIFVLALIAAAVIAFGGDKVDVIAETARRSPGRAAAVGVAATLLFVTIPVAIAWLPLFPLAAVAAGVLGYLAVARNTGEWLADSDYPWTHWIRKSNTLVTTVGGLVGLTVLYVAANVVSMAPFLRVVTGLLVAAGTLVTVLAVEVGLGAVILTRAGRRRDQWSSYTADEAWEAAMRVEVEDVDVEDVRDGEGKGSPTGAESAKREENDA
jgi:hypothetical protein